MNSHRKQVLASWPVWLLGVLLCLTGGCSSFNRAWREVGRQPTQTDSIEGRWEGRWLSEVNGHQGRLRCLMTRQTDGDYAARFRASYMKVLRFGYAVTLNVELRDGVWHFHGEEDLGKLAGGVYRYAGRATRTDFHSSYNSKHDHGTFEMRRVASVESAEPP